jgi:iron complex transport system ATP-binding protein
MTSSVTFGCRNIAVSVPGRRLVESLNFDLCRGQFLAVLGPNGTGKSLTLHTLAGLRGPDEGSVTLNGIAVNNANRHFVAQHLSLLPQYTEDVFPSTVLDTVLVGRHPHIGRFHWESSADRAMAIDALGQVDLAEMQLRDIATLSGGERRRAAIAQVITQSPDVFLLDEPTNHLDPQHQLDVLQLMRKKTESGCIVLASLHDVNLAVRFADSCLLLFGDGRWVLGETDDVLTEERLSELYSARMESINWRDRTLYVAAGDGPA